VSRPLRWLTHLGNFAGAHTVEDDGIADPEHRNLGVGDIGSSADVFIARSKIVLAATAVKRRIFDVE